MTGNTHRGKISSLEIMLLMACLAHGFDPQRGPTNFSYARSCLIITILYMYVGVHSHMAYARRRCKQNNFYRAKRIDNPANK